MLLRDRFSLKKIKLSLPKQTCSICGFLLDVEVEGEHKRWYNFVVEREHLFLRNIFTLNELKEMKKDKNTIKSMKD